jgi:hypothetical protein
LWFENAEAWEIFQTLRGHAVKGFQLESWIIHRWTEGWDMERIATLMDRLNLIASVLEPNGPTQT